MTILYIDDDPEDREIFEEAVKLVDPTTECLSAANGREAFALLGNLEKLPEHIVMDNNMPGMDGKSVLQELRRDPSFDNIHITLYSTNSLPRDIEEIESLGATFVKKANSFQDLCNMIRALPPRGRISGGL